MQTNKTRNLFTGNITNYCNNHNCCWLHIQKEYLTYCTKYKSDLKNKCSDHIGVNK
jgi:hypothetical protein